MQDKLQLSSKSIWNFNLEKVEKSKIMPTANELVMAWARDIPSQQPIYILELGEHQRGSKCNCECVSCGLPLVAVNAAKTEYQQRPHFRHPKGAERSSCLILAARFAIAQQLLELGYIELPRRRRSSRLEGLSGVFHEAWVELPPERVLISGAKFKDTATAILTLDDGRELVVELTGGLSEPQNPTDALCPTITLNFIDASVASMSPDELRSRLKLLWTGACWKKHWQDAQLAAEAEIKARKIASDALDWLDDVDGLTETNELTKEQKRETLLHIEVKAILANEKRINLPELVVNVEHEAPRKDTYKRVRRWESEFVSLENVYLEKRLGRIIPDVIAHVIVGANISYQLLIEVTVTNPINAERLERIKLVNLPTLEIDVGRMGGVVSRSELVSLVVEELAAKRWIHHPKAVEEFQKLNAEVEVEIQRLFAREEKRKKLLDAPLETKVHNFIKSFTSYVELNKHNEQAVSEENQEDFAFEELDNSIYALIKSGYPESAEVKENPSTLERILRRLLSIKFDTGIGYRMNTGWQVINTIHLDLEQQRTWHTIYLIAIKNYKPKLNNEQSRKTNEWRSKVLDSIQQGEKTYLRSTKYDRLISLLFPELKPYLDKDFGKLVRSNSKLQSDTNKYQSANTNKNEASLRRGSFWLKGKELEEWKHKYPESAKIWFPEE